jgi:hypothetical protein
MGGAAKVAPESHEGQRSRLARAIARAPVVFLLAAPLLCLILFGLGLRVARIEDQLDEIWMLQRGKRVGKKRITDEDRRAEVDFIGPSAHRKYEDSLPLARETPSILLTISSARDEGEEQRRTLRKVAPVVHGSQEILWRRTSCWKSATSCAKRRTCRCPASLSISLSSGMCHPPRYLAGRRGRSYFLLQRCVPECRAVRLPLHTNQRHRVFCRGRLRFWDSGRGSPEACFLFFFPRPILPACMTLRVDSL